MLPTLRADRLLLRPFVLADASDVQRLAGNRSIADTTLTIPHPYEDGMAEDWIATQRSAIAAGEQAVFAVMLETKDQLLGAAGLTIDRDFDRADLGYWIGEPYWGQGYCTEAAKRLIEFGLTELKLNRITASHFDRNPASGQVLQKVGMLREGVARQHVMKWGRYEDLVLYGLLRHEWSRRQR